MSIRIDVTALARAIGAETPGGLEERELTGVVIDNRKITTGQIFVGLPGEKTHGQRFAAQALDAGAGAVIVEDLAAANCENKKNVLVVPSAEKALQEAARFVRNELDCPLIGITGTNGKTTTKEVVATVLEALFGHTHSTSGNFNNHLGLPISLLSMPAGAQYGVFELGMSNLGEIDFIAHILKPRIGIITNIGEAHLETMGTVERIVDAKSELLAHVQKDGLLLLNGDCPWHKEIASRFDGKVKYVGVTTKGEARGLDAELLNVDVGLDYVEGDIVLGSLEGVPSLGRVRLPIAGVHLASSFLFAVLVALELGAERSAIPSALQCCKAAWGRMQAKDYGGVHVINDGYNANPASMEAALKHLSLQDGTVWAVLGEMLELGEARDRSHREVGKLACQLLGAKQVYLLGHVYEDVKIDVATAKVLLELPQIAKELKGAIKTGDTLLIKASRGVGIERLLPMLFEE